MPPGTAARLRDAALASLACSAILLYFFCPRFVLWKGLDYPESWFNPEVNRAVSAAGQLINPFVKIENPSNKVIQWRLLFPLVFHFLRLPRSFFFAVPHIGCLLVLGLIIRVVMAATGDWLYSCLSALVLGSASWFFVSMGWLAYFDSWYVLALLTASFNPARSALIASCLLAPWVDERFVLAFPLCFLVRCAVLKRFARAEAAAAAVVLAPYLILRAVLAGLGGDADSKSYLAKALADPYSAMTVLQGIWQGLRGGWLFALVFFHASASRPVVLLAGLLTLVVNLFIAGDISRSMCVFIPAALAGILLLAEKNWRACRISLLIALFVSLAAPAKHVLRTFSVPIASLPVEIGNFREPPLYLTPEGYMLRGEHRLKSGNVAGAMEDFATARRLRRK